MHQVLEIRGKHAQVKTCLAIERRIKECKEILSQHKANAERNAGLIAAAKAFERHEKTR